MSQRSEPTSPLRTFGADSAGLTGLLSLRLNSYDNLLRCGVASAVRDFRPVRAEVGASCEVSLADAKVLTPEHSVEECLRTGRTYEAEVRAVARLRDLRTGEVVEQPCRLCRLPLMDAGGGMVINGVRKVVIHQIVRAPGAWFSYEHDPMTDKRMGRGRISPERGSWLSFEVNDKGVLRARLNGGNSLDAMCFPRLFGLESDGAIISAFLDVCSSQAALRILFDTLDESECKTRDDALLRVYAEIAPGSPPRLKSAAQRINRVFFDDGGYSLSPLGRHMLNRKFCASDESMQLTATDVMRCIAEVLLVTTEEAEPDDVDHLGNRRVRTAGELVQAELEAGLYDVYRSTRRRLEMSDAPPQRPMDALDITGLQRRISNFFAASKLCQVLDNTNLISELTHKRRITSLGPGGLNRQNAGVSPRDVHHTYYGKVCPIETPEGQNIGLLSTLATEVAVDEDGLLASPARRILKRLPVEDDRLLGRRLTDDALSDGRLVAVAGTVVDKAIAAELVRREVGEVSVQPFVSEEVVYLNGFEEESAVIAQWDAAIDDKGVMLDESVVCRYGADRAPFEPNDIGYIDVSPRQVVSASTALIPFLEHDDANRALMGCNMQRQAVPLVQPQPGLVSTGMERRIAADSPYTIRASHDGSVISVTPECVSVRRDDGGTDDYRLRRWERSNAFTVLGQRPTVLKYQRVSAGDVLAEALNCREGELTLGQRVLVAYMSWGGYNYEDAIILSERIVREGKFRSRIVKRYRLDALNTQLGSEIITKDIPDVALRLKKAMGENGIVEVGAYVKAGQVLVGKVTPRPSDLDGWEALVEKVFEDTGNSQRFKNASLVLPKGQQGRVVSVKVVRKEDGDDAEELPAGCHTRVEVEVMGTRDVQAGDKMSGRHGNKGCVSIVVPQEDMPFLPDGTPVDVILSPLGVPSRMNLGQLMEVHLGWAAHRMGFRAVTPVFDSARWQEVEQCLAQAWLVEHAGGIRREDVPQDDMCRVDWGRVRAWTDRTGYSFEALFGDGATARTEPGRVCLTEWMRVNGRETPDTKDYSELKRIALSLDRNENIAAPITGKQVLRDGKTGDPFDRPVMVGYKYMLKLVHMVEDKMHARSTGTYSAITQQPLGGKGAGGGQRMGEMEVWAFEAYSAAHVLLEMLTVKSDDMEGRNAVTKAAMSNRDYFESESTVIGPGIPMSFELLLAELRSLGLNPELLYDYETTSEQLDDAM